MNRFTGLNGLNFNAFPSANPKTSAADTSGFADSAKTGNTSESQSLESEALQSESLQSESLPSDATPISSTHSEIAPSTIYQAKLSLTGYKSGGLLSSDVFDVIFGSGIAAESEKAAADGSVAKNSSPLFFSPLHYEARYDYPLIVWLHGCGSSERELEELMPHISIRNYVAVAPRGTKAMDPNGHRYSWGETPASITLAEELVFDAIEKVCGRFNIANRKIFLAGRGTGGTMAWRIALRYPKQFAGCVSLGGAFPKSHRPLAALKDLRHLRTLWMVGEQSNTCGIDEVVNSLPLFHAARLRVAIRQYNCGDELYADMFSDLNRWLMEIVTHQASAPEEEACVWGGLTGLN